VRFGNGFGNTAVYSRIHPFPVHGDAPTSHQSPEPYQHHLLLYVAYYIIATLGYFVLLLIWRKGTERVKEKREAAILLLSYFTGIAPVLIILLLNYYGI